MLKYSAILLALVMPCAVYAAADCAVPPLSKSDRTAAASAAAKNLAATNPCNVSPGLAMESLAGVWAKLLSNPKTGGRRLETAVPVGLPNGSTLAGPAGAHFDFQQVAAEEIRSFRLEQNGRIILSVATPPLALDVPVSAQGAYNWSLQTRINTYRGEFTPLAGVERSRVQAQLAAVDRSGIDALSTLIYKAAIYDEADLYSERDLALMQARKLAADL